LLQPAFRIFIAACKLWDKTFIYFYLRHILPGDPAENLADHRGRNTILVGQIDRLLIGPASTPAMNERSSDGTVTQAKVATAP
jgi:hypothetical protein